jgi:hypothetical protein
MRFLFINETAEWCREHGMEVGERWELLPDAQLTHVSRLLHLADGTPANAARITEASLVALGPWDECLLWLTDWDIWEQNEDWPGFYAARGARGERHSLASKPGHLFGAGEADDLRLFLTMVVQNSWDAHVLPVQGGAGERRLRCSHDGWVELAAATLVEIAQAAV